jgi:hypothetical protein
MATSLPSDTWHGFVETLTAVEQAIARVTAVKVNTASARSAAKGLIQNYFRVTRPDMLSIGIDASALAEMDAAMQALLQLANGRNAKASYVRTLRAIRREAEGLELAREYQLGEVRQAATATEVVIPEVEARILGTLRELVPTAALSYEQALRDLHSSDRVSYRGTANELREALRETVDRLAPDDDVIASPGFKLERDRSKPTQKQKVRHILRSRGLSDTARKAPEDSVELVDALTSSVARSSYERSSISAHVASTEREVRQLKMYVDSVLAELLQIHA